MATDTQKAQPKVRLTQAELEQLRRKLPQVWVGPETTAHQAGFQLGIQLVLAKLEEGWTIS